MTALQTWWDKLPIQVRTVINIALGAAVTAVISYGTNVLSGGQFQLNELVQLVLTAVATAVVRQVNPLDSYPGTPAPAPVAGE